MPSINALELITSVRVEGLSELREAKRIIEEVARNKGNVDNIVGNLRGAVDVVDKLERIERSISKIIPTGGQFGNQLSAQYLLQKIGELESKGLDFVDIMLKQIGSPAQLERWKKSVRMEDVPADQWTKIVGAVAKYSLGKISASNIAGKGEQEALDKLVRGFQGEQYKGIVEPMQLLTSSALKKIGSHGPLSAKIEEIVVESAGPALKDSIIDMLQKNIYSWIIGSGQPPQILVDRYNELLIKKQMTAAEIATGGMIGGRSGTEEAEFLRLSGIQDAIAIASLSGQVADVSLTPSDTARYKELKAKGVPQSILSAAKGRYRLGKGQGVGFSPEEAEEWSGLEIVLRRATDERTQKEAREDIITKLMGKPPAYFKDMFTKHPALIFDFLLKTSPEVVESIGKGLASIGMGGSRLSESIEVQKAFSAEYGFNVMELKSWGQEFDITQIQDYLSAISEKTGDPIQTMVDKIRKRLGSKANLVKNETSLMWLLTLGPMLQGEFPSAVMLDLLKTIEPSQLEITPLTETETTAAQIEKIERAKAALSATGLENPDVKKAIQLLEKQQDSLEQIIKNTQKESTTEQDEVEPGSE